MISTLFSDY